MGETGSWNGMAYENKKEKVKEEQIKMKLNVLETQFLFDMNGWTKAVRKRVHWRDATDGGTGYEGSEQCLLDMARDL